MNWHDADKQHQYALVVIPPQAIWKPIQNIRREYDHNLRRWMPHITLCYPYYPVEYFPAIAATLQPNCRKIAPFAVKLTQLSYFKQRNRFVLWLAPEPKHHLCALFDAVTSLEQNRSTRGAFEPHLTVGYIKGRQNFEKVHKRLAKNWEPLQFEVREIHLLWRNDPPDDIFQIERTIALGHRYEEPG